MSCQKMTVAKNMLKKTVLSLISIFFCISCEDQKKDVKDFLKRYYRDMDNFDEDILEAMFKNSAMDLFEATVRKKKFMKDNFQDVKKYFEKYSKDAETGRELRLVFDDLLAERNFQDKFWEYKRKYESTFKMKRNFPHICQSYISKHDCNETIGYTVQNLEDIFATNRDYYELRWLWEEWRKATGSENKGLFWGFVRESNNFARKFNYMNYMDFLLGKIRLEDDLGKIVVILNQLWIEISLDYNVLYEYIFRRLKYLYRVDIEEKEKIIPAHVTGSFYSETFSKLHRILKLYPREKDRSFEVLFSDRASFLEIINAADRFLVSMGFESVKDFAIVANSSLSSIDLCSDCVYVFRNGSTVFELQAWKIKEDRFAYVLRKMVMFLYEKSTKELPYVYKKFGNYWMIWAMADAFLLSVTTFEGTKDLGVLENFEYNERSERNHLMNVTIKMLSSLPYLFHVQKWMTDVFEGTTRQDDLNPSWWQSFMFFSKLRAPTASRRDFDPGASRNLMIVDERVSKIFQTVASFQIYRYLCIMTGKYDPRNFTSSPLFMCNLHGSGEVGEILNRGLGMLGRKNYTEVLKIITGTDYVSYIGMKEYVSPLFSFLKKNKKKKWVFGGPMKNIMLMAAIGIAVTVGIVVILLIMYLSIRKCKKWERGGRRVRHFRYRVVGTQTRKMDNNEPTTSRDQSPSIDEVTIEEKEIKSIDLTSGRIEHSAKEVKSKQKNVKSVQTSGRFVDLGGFKRLKLGGNPRKLRLKFDTVSGSFRGVDDVF